MRDLTMQAGNDNYTTADVEAMNEEMIALSAELGDITERTDFAGVDLLGGGSFTFQVGSDAGDTITIEIDDMSAIATSAAGIHLTASMSAADTSAAIGKFDDLLKLTDDAKSDLGADINRLESKIDNLANVEQNMAVSQSRMLDADLLSKLQR